MDGMRAVKPLLSDFVVFLPYLVRPPVCDKYIVAKFWCSVGTASSNDVIFYVPPLMKSLSCIVVKPDART